MGNKIGGGGGGGRRKTAKVMRINGESLKFKTPIQAWDIVKDYPGHVLLESDSVKQFGIRAKPLEPQQQLKPKKIYFLVELPKLLEGEAPRRVRSGIHYMSAKDRLDCLMLSRRAVSDLTDEKTSNSGRLQVKMRLPRAQLAKLVEESKDEGEVAEKIVDLYVQQQNWTGRA